MKWRKCCFKTYNKVDCEQIPYTYWVVDSDNIGFKECYTICGFFPSDVNLSHYWDTVFDMDFVERDIEELTEREMINFADNGYFFSLKQWE